MKNKKLSVLTLSALVAIAFLFQADNVLAATPTLQLTSTGDGDSVQINVIGNPGKSVILYYTKKDNGPFVSSLGTTNANGAFTTTISAASYNIVPSSMVHVIVDGLQSADIAWPYVAAGSTISLSNTSLILALGQSSTITAYNNGTNLLYLSSNSNPPIANANITGSQIAITALNYGATIITVCSQNSQATCASAYINVQNSGTPLAFSQNNVSIVPGQSVSISIFGGNGSYLITNNQNSSVIQSNISGTTVTLNALGSSGSSPITVCSSDMSSCGIINANIGNVNSTGLTLNPNNPSLVVGQNISINITGGTDNTYSVYSNSNTSAVQAVISSNAINLSGLSGGSSIITVCSSVGKCASVTATVLGNTSGGGLIVLSQNNLWLSVGQSFGITISGGTMPYSVPANPDMVASTSINNSILTITGLKPGSTSLGVCSAGGGCTTLAVLVNGVTSSNIITLGTSSVSVAVGGSQAVAIFGNGGYFVANNTNQVIASVSLSGSNAVVSGLNMGNNSVSICQNGGQCAVLSISVTAAQSSSSNTTTTTTATTGASQTQALTTSYPDNTLVRDQEGRIFVIINNTKRHITGPAELRANFAGKAVVNITDSNVSLIPDALTVAQKFKFTAMLSYGSSGSSVKELQKILVAEGFFKEAVSGRYLTSTVIAVKKYQKSRGIRQTGNIGPMTLEALNK